MERGSVLFLWLLFGVRGLVIRDYNRVDFFEFPSLSLLTGEYFPQGIASKNVLLGIATEECLNLLHAPAFRGAQKFTGGRVVVSASIPLSESPIPLESCAKLFWYPIGSPVNVPAKSFILTELISDALDDWVFSLTRVDQTISNGFDFPIQLMWKDETAKSSTPSGVIDPGQAVLMHTYLGHIFYALRMDGQEASDEIVDYFVVDGGSYQLSAQNKLQTCDNAGSDLLTLQISCDNMDLRLDAFAHDVWMHKRIGLNYFQPQIVPALTQDGFRLIRLPAETYQWLKEWYDHRKQLEHKEESSSGPCMNQHKAPSKMTHLLEAEKRRLAAELQPIMEDWYGNGSLYMTSIYGVRKYSNASILRMHVDTLATHVISAIINIDQEVSHPWKLLILDHQDREHEVEMAPGDMVLYESAKLLHGRPKEMVGERYENIFVHYKPVEGWNYR